MCRPGWARALTEAQHLRTLVRLRRVRDRLDREYARPLDVLALARAAGMAAGQLGREFELAYGSSPYAYVTARRAAVGGTAVGGTAVGGTAVRGTAVRGTAVAATG